MKCNELTGTEVPFKKTHMITENIEYCRLSGVNSCSENLSTAALAAATSITPLLQKRVVLLPGAHAR